MYCFLCKCNIEDNSGSQMTGCQHFLCTECISKEIQKCKSPGLKCTADKGVYKCNGKISHEDLEHILSEENYKKYLEGIEATGDAGEGNKNADDAKKQQTTLEDLNLSKEEKDSGWAHKASLIDELVRFKEYSHDDAVKHLDNLPLIETRAPIKCSICQKQAAPAEGVVLKDCNHMFCKVCIKAHICDTDTAEVKCPFIAHDHKCDEPLKASEVRALVDAAEYYRHYLDLSLQEASTKMPHVFRCLTAECKGFCQAEVNVGFYTCEICKARNCLSCKVIHDGTCSQYKQKLEPVDQQESDDEENEVLRAVDDATDDIKNEEPEILERDEQDI